MTDTVLVLLSSSLRAIAGLGCRLSISARWPCPLRPLNAPPPILAVSGGNGTVGATTDTKPVEPSPACEHCRPGRELARAATFCPMRSATEHLDGSWNPMQSKSYYSCAFACSIFLSSTYTGTPPRLSCSLQMRLIATSARQTSPRGSHHRNSRFLSAPCIPILMTAILQRNILLDQPSLPPHSHLPRLT